MLQPICGRKRGFAAPPTPVFCDRSPCVPTEKERTPPHREHVHWPECSIPKRPFRASAGEGPGQTPALLYHWVSVWEGSHSARTFPDRKGAWGHKEVWTFSVLFMLLIIFRKVRPLSFLRSSPTKWRGVVEIAGFGESLGDICRK